MGWLSICLKSSGCVIDVSIVLGFIALFGTLGAIAVGSRLSGRHLSNLVRAKKESEAGQHLQNEGHRPVKEQLTRAAAERLTRDPWETRITASEYGPIPVQREATTLGKPGDHAAKGGKMSQAHERRSERGVRELPGIEEGGELSLPDSHQLQLQQAVESLEAILSNYNISFEVLAAEYERQQIDRRR